MQKAGTYESPSSACMDIQSINTTRLDGECWGFGGGKLIIGRKRPIVSDTMDLLLAVVAHAANVHDSIGVSDSGY